MDWLLLAAVVLAFAGIVVGMTNELDEIRRRR
jgi:hypothetical protein